MVVRLIWPLIAALACASPALAADPLLVGTEGGAVRGMPGTAPGLRQFRGIPYAASPVGDLRWRPPAPPARWAQVLSADHFAPDCISPRADASVRQSEDCLYLNIWAPPPSARKLPVMVWIYGGAFESGSAADPHFDGTNLNRKGVILVTFGYRTSIFGYLSNPLLTAESPHHASGNYGLMDAAAALAWVRRNIGGFGGDPANVTIFGQSSGSESVHALTLSPLAHGLFDKAIGESGSGFGGRQPPTLAVAEARGARAVETLGGTKLGGTLAQLRAVPAMDLAAAALGKRFEPVVDGWFLPADAYGTYAGGRANDVPTLVGVNGGEVLAPREAVTRASYIERVQQRFGTQTPAILSAFPAENDEQAREASQRLNHLLFIDFGMASWANGQMRSGRAPVWQYRFNHAPPADPARPMPLAARHGDEIRYAFDNLAQEQRPWGRRDRELAAIMSSYWTNFAKKGDPNGPGLPRWDRLTPKAPQMLTIGDDIAMQPRPDSEGIALLERVFYAPGGVFRAP